MEKKYDLIVIGCGPAGEKAATKAAYFKKKVAVIEQEKYLGGAGVNTGTLPSKTLKQTVLFLSGKYEKGLYGIERSLERSVSVSDFLYRKDQVISSQREMIQKNLSVHNIDLYEGLASFIDKNHIRVKGTYNTILSADRFLIATGSYPYHPPDIPFDYKRIHDSDSILNLDRFPKSICIIGAGVIGCEYATIFANLGIPTYLVNSQKKILNFLDDEISAALVNQMKKEKIHILFDTTLKKIHAEDANRDIKVVLSNDDYLHVDMLLYAAGRSGNIKNLDLDKAGVKSGPRETVVVDETYRSSTNRIYAVGDVIGFPALASTSMDQGRVAVSHMFGIKESKSFSDILPFGIYTIPEVSMVGITSQEAEQSKEDYVVGVASFQDMMRGQILGVDHGFLKIICRQKTGVIEGVHIIGHMATEIVHYGMQLVQHKESIHDVIGHVFNVPTFHSLYKYAAYDALGGLKGYKVKEIKIR